MLVPLRVNVFVRVVCVPAPYFHDLPGFVAFFPLMLPEFQEHAGNEEEREDNQKHGSATPRPQRC
jgi:hypothetical protein